MVRIAVPDFLAGDHGVDLAFILGWSRVLSGHFSPVEIAMTLIIGVASAFGIATIFRWRTATRPFAAAALFVLFAALQLIAFRISMLPAIAHQ